MQFKGRTVIAFVLLGMLASSIITLVFTSSTNPALSSALASVFGTNKQAVDVQSAPGANAASKISDKDMNKIAKTYQLISQSYLSKVDNDTIVNGAINGMLGALDDPFTTYMDQKEAKEFDESISSSFQGIGAEVTMENGKVKVVSPIKGSPAEKAGVHSEDIIISVNGEKLEGLTLNQAVMKIRGEKGTQAKLEIVRAGVSEPIQMTIVRADIDLETVYAEMLDGNIGKIEITQFATNTAEHFLRELSALESKGMKSLIIDVRNDPGGLLNAVVEIASQFVPKGKPIVIVEDRNGKQEKTLSTGSAKPYPVVVLTNKGSASASEILAGALQESTGAKVVGETTYGKGTVQITFAKELGDGSNIKMTVFKWLTPNGNWIHKKGITPDIVVEQPEFFKVSPLTKKSDLKVNTSSDDVKNAQIMLSAIGHKTDRSDGYFSDQTVEAVKKFQKSVQLPVTGVIDAETAGKLEQAMLAEIKDPDNDLQLKAAIKEINKQIVR